MASGKALNVANLESLGAARLAELLVEIRAGDAAAKRRLRLALAGSAGSGKAAREVAKRLASIAKAKSFIDWQKVKPLAADLEAQRRAILDLVAPTDPGEAFDLLWRLVGCAETVFARSDDGSGRLSAAFCKAARDLGPLVQGAKLDPIVLAARIFTALCDDGYGTWDGVIPILAPQLGAAGLNRLRELIAAWKAEPIAVPSKHERQVVGWSSAGEIYADEIETGHRRHTAKFVLQQIADVLGDVDSYIAQIDADARNAPVIAAAIARRLLAAGRPQEAWDALEAARQSKRDRIPVEWEQARIDTLEALGRPADAQAFRWERFLATLNATHLRAHLRALPDFEDFEAEQRALAHALTYSDVHQAFGFFIAWPDLERASQLVLARAHELNGDHYELLTPAGDALEAKHPLASTLVRRAMIDFTLGGARPSRYKHAARHLAECRSMARCIDDFGGVPDHAAYGRALRATQRRKSGFWQEASLFS
jgi:tetratricopeptide (TPR) repeat protein